LHNSAHDGRNTPVTAPPGEELGGAGEGTTVCSRPTDAAQGGAAMADAARRKIQYSRDSGWAIRHGVLGGLLAGLVFAMAAMLAAWLMQGWLVRPLHLFASIPLQMPPALIDPVLAIPVGVVTHLLFSVLFGVVAASLVTRFPDLRRSPRATVTFGTVFGFMLFPINFHLLARAMSLPWFATEVNPSLQLTLHTVAFGTVLGLYLAAQLPRRRT
jgi:hypothetical protein